MSSSASVSPSEQTKQLLARSGKKRLALIKSESPNEAPVQSIISNLKRRRLKGKTSETVATEEQGPSKSNNETSSSSDASSESDTEEENSGVIIESTTEREDGKKLRNGWESTGNKWWNLGLDTNWVRSGNSSVALRELTQNFCDQILKTSNSDQPIAPSPPELYTQRNATVYAVKDSDQTVLGYMVHDPDRKLFALVNKNCYLPRAALNIGFTTKDGERFMGKFGEGLKRAIVACLSSSKILEIHQSGRTLAFKKSTHEEEDGPHNRIFYKISPSYQNEDVKNLMVWMKRNKLADRNLDLVHVLGGFDDPVSVLNYFLHFSFRDGQDYHRLPSVHGDILLPVEEQRKSIIGRVYVAGVLWMQNVDGQKRYGLELKKGVSDNRDRNQIERSSYEETIAKVIDAVILTPNKVNDQFISVLLKELHESHKVHDIPHLHQLGRFLSRPSAARLKKSFMRLYGNDKKYVIAKEEANPALKKFLDVKETCVVTSAFFCKILRRKGVCADLTEIMSEAKETLLASPVTEFEWSDETKQAVELTFKPFNIWAHLKMHSTPDGGITS